MRRKREAVLCFESSDDGLPKVVRDYRARYRAISQVLDDNPEILSAVHQDLLKLSEGDSTGPRGRLHLGEHPAGPDRPAPRRAALPRDGHPHRQRSVPPGLPADAEEGRDGLLASWTSASWPSEPQTWKRVNELLGQYGVAEEAVNTNVIRTDTTVVESNIHYPTDASLLWDTWRVASRLLKRAREIDPASVPAPLPRPEDQAAVSVRHPLHAEQVGVAPAEGESDVPHADRADGLDRGDCRGILRPGRLAGQLGPGGRGLGTEGLSAVDEDGRRHRPAGPDRRRDGSGRRSGCSASSSRTRN